MYFVIPEDENCVARVEASALTEFTSRIVTTSFGLASSQDDIDASQVVRRPASYKAQLKSSVLTHADGIWSKTYSEWHRWSESSVELAACICALNNRTPASS